MYVFLCLLGLTLSNTTFAPAPELTRERTLAPLCALHRVGDILENLLEYPIVPLEMRHVYMCISKVIRGCTGVGDVHSRWAPDLSVLFVQSFYILVVDLVTNITKIM